MCIEKEALQVAQVQTVDLAQFLLRVKQPNLTPEIPLTMISPVILMVIGFHSPSFSYMQL